MKRLRRFVILTLALCMVWAMTAAVIAAEPDEEGVTSTFTFTNQGEDESEPEPTPTPEPIPIPEPTPEPEPTVDKTALEEEYASDYDLNESDYTPESWAPFEEALVNAVAVLADPDATQEEVNAALAELEAARAALVEVEKKNPGTGGTGGTGSTGGTGTTGSNGGTGTTGNTEGSGSTSTTSAGTGDIGIAPYATATAAAGACIVVLLGVCISRKRRYGKEGR